MPERRRWVLLFFLGLGLGLALLLAAELARAAPEPPLVELGPTEINNRVVYDSSRLEVTGNLTVAAGGELVIRDSSLLFKNYSSTPQFEVQEGGKLQILNSAVSSQSGFNFVLRGETLIDKANISGLAPRRLDLEITILYWTWTDFPGGGLEIYSSGVVVSNSTIVTNSNSNLITIFNTSPVIVGNSFSQDIDNYIPSRKHNLSAYIFIIEGSPSIRDNTFNKYIYSHSGLFFYRSTGQFSFNTLYDNNRIALVDSSPVIANNFFTRVQETDQPRTENGYIDIYRYSNPEIIQNYFDNGTLTYYAGYNHSTYFTTRPVTNPMVDNTFIGNDGGFIFLGFGDFAIVDSQLIHKTYNASNPPYGYLGLISLSYNGKLRLINTTFSPDLFFVPLGTLDIQWYLRLKVTDEFGTPVSGVTVEGFSAADTSRFTVSTNSKGLTPRLTLTQKVYGSGHRPTDTSKYYSINVTDYNPYTFTVSLGDRRVEQTVWVNESQTVEVVLPNLPDLAWDLGPYGHLADSAAAPVGRPVRLAATAVNSGLGTAPASEAVLTLVGGGSSGGEGGGSIELERFALPPLGPGESHVVKYNYTPEEPGTYTFRLVLDPAGAVAEADETNNEATATVRLVKIGTTVPSFALGWWQLALAAVAVVVAKRRRGGGQP